MQKRSAQAPAAVIMIRPHHFTPNHETVSDNAFQSSADGIADLTIHDAAYDEATIAANDLQEVGVRVHGF